MKRIYLFALSFGLWMLSLNSFAQYSINMEQYVLTNYRSVTQTFSLSEICTALETDTASFYNDFWDWYDNGGENIVTLESDGSSTNYTQGGRGGYWMSADGKAVNWATSNCVWCVLMYPEVEDDKLYFEFWQMPDMTKAGDKFHCDMAINYNGNQLTFAIDVTVVEKPDLGIETSLSKLNILGKTEVTITQEPRTDYASDVVSFDLTDALAALKYDNVSTVSNNFSDYLYMAWYDKTNMLKEDKLRNTWTANSGFWTGAYYDADTDEETGELIENVDWKIYIENFHLDAETNILTCNVGQQPNALKNSEHYWLPMYLINGNNAYILQVNINTTEPNPEDVEKDFSEKTKVGEEEVVFYQNPNSSYAVFYPTPSIDIDKIIGLLGVEKSKVKFYAETGPGEVSSQGNAGSSTGFWLDKDGYIIAWGDYSWATIAYNGSNLTSCQMPGRFANGDVYTLRCYLAGPQTYYQFNVTYRFEEYKGIDMSQYEMMSDEMFEFQIIPGDYWSNDHLAAGIDLDPDHLKEMLGTGSYTFLGETLNDNDSVLVTDNYTCDPHPAFWMTDDYVSAYGGSNSFAILWTAASNKFQFIQMPNAKSVGDAYCSHFFLLNKDTKKYIRYTIYVEYVDQIVNWQTVGNESLVLPTTGEDGEYAETPYDMTKCYDALSCDQESFGEMGQWKAVNGDGKLTTEGYQDEMYGFWFDKDGEPTDDPDAQLYSAEFLTANQSDSGEACFRTYAFEEGTYQLTLAAEYDGKRYFFHITLTDNATGIKDTSANASANTDDDCYNLAGQKVINGYKGIVIKNGKKVFVNK